MKFSLMKFKACVVNPFQNEGVSQHLERLKDYKSTVDTQSTSTKAANSLPAHLDSPLTKLADEIVLEILLNLPYEDIRNFVFYGLAAINLAEAQGYWERKISVDSPLGSSRARRTPGLSSRYITSYDDNALLPCHQLITMMKVWSFQNNCSKISSNF